MAEAPQSEAGIVSVSQAAKLLMLESDRRVQQLVNEGWIPKPDTRGKYSTIGVVQGYIKFLKHQLSEKNLNSHANRLTDVRARQVELKNAKDEHELVEYDEVSTVLDEIAGLLKSEFEGLGAQVTRDQTMRKKIDASVDGIFGRAQARILETLKALAESGEVVETDAEDDAS